MNTAVARLAAFGVVLAIALGVGVAVGAAVGPEPARDAPATPHDLHVAPRSGAGSR